MKRWIILILLFPTMALGAPNITGVAGTYTNGQTITVSGSGFGTKTTAYPHITSYDSPPARTSDNWAEGSFSARWDRNNLPVISNSAPLRTGLYQSSYKAVDTDDGGYHWYGAFTGNANDKIYTSFYTYRDAASWTVTGHGQKIWRMNLATAAPMNNMYLQLHQNGTSWDFVSESCTCQGTCIYPVPYPVVSGCSAGVATSNFSGFWDTTSSCLWSQQAWDHWEIYVDLATYATGGDGEIIIWLNGRIHQHITQASTFASGQNNDNRAVWVGKVSGESQGSSGVYYDQLYIDTTPQRVIISSASNLAATWPDYTSTHHSEIQVPATWSDTSLTFTLNQGTFGDTDTVYVYVVDGSGVISSGYEITLSGSGTPAAVRGALTNGGFRNGGIR